MEWAREVLKSLMFLSKYRYSSALEPKSGGATDALDGGIERAQSNACLARSEPGRPRPSRLHNKPIRFG
jgi:hypothetical protein